MSAPLEAVPESTRSATHVAYGVLLSICFCHLINDMLQSLLAASYPTLKAQFGLTFAQVGLVTLTYQLTASFLQPLVGLAADKRPAPFSLPIGTLFTFAGLVMLSLAGTYAGLLVGACVLGIGSSVFHPESSRVARMAAGGRPGLAQSLFQVGGNVGSTLGPAGAAVVVTRWGQGAIGGFAVMALVSTVILTRVGLWYQRVGLARLVGARESSAAERHLRPLPAGPRVALAIGVLLVLVFSKFVYLASLSSYYTFYLIHRFEVPVQAAQIYLLIFFSSVAAGTLAGGPFGDRFGRKVVIWVSILGVLPFTLMLPYVNLFWTAALSVVIGFLLASAFPAIVVYGQELIPGRVGLVSGLFFGLSFGAGGAGAAVLGAIADATSIEHVYWLCSFLPAIGLAAGLLPDLRAAPPAHRPAGAPVVWQRGQ